jgi:alkylation response protein AidB-like acyl-CoA dehydrogenase
MTPEPYPEIRAAVAKLCAKGPGDDWPKLDRDMPCPQAFVDALTSTGWLAVLIPEDHGCARLPLSAAAAVLKEMQRAGCNRGARPAHSTSNASSAKPACSKSRQYRPT